MHTLNREMNQIKHMIEKKIRHPYVEKYIEKPLIDFDKLYILHYLYKDLDISEIKKQQYIITIMLVQIALDTHELVPRNGSGQMNNTEKQLSVLAGDYYSGLYYFLLSEMEDIKMIQILATAIQKINENKMMVYYENVTSVDELIDKLREIESLLFTEVACFLEENYELIPIIKELLLINRLYKEKEEIVTNKTSYLEKYVERNITNSSKNATITIVDNKIDVSKRELDRLLSRLSYRCVSLEELLRERIELSYNTSVAEEG